MMRRLVYIALLAAVQRLDVVPLAVILDEAPAVYLVGVAQTEHHRVVCIHGSLTEGFSATVEVGGSPELAHDGISWLSLLAKGLFLVIRPLSDDDALVEHS